MFPNKEKHKIIIPILKDGLYEIIIKSKDDTTVFSDCISSKNQKIILTGFSKHLYKITLIPVLITSSF